MNQPYTAEHVPMIVAGETEEDHGGRRGSCGSDGFITSERSGRGGGGLERVPARLRGKAENGGPIGPCGVVRDGGHGGTRGPAGGLGDASEGAGKAWDRFVVSLSPTFPSHARTQLEVVSVPAPFSDR